MKPIISLLFCIALGTNAVGQVTVRAKDVEQTYDDGLTPTQRLNRDFVNIRTVSILPTDAILGSFPILYQYSFTPVFSAEVGLGPTLYMNTWLNRVIPHFFDDSFSSSRSSNGAGMVAMASGKFFVNRGGITKRAAGFVSFNYAYRDWKYQDLFGSVAYDGNIVWHTATFNTGGRFLFWQKLVVEVYSGYGAHWMRHSIDLNVEPRKEKLNGQAFSFGVKLGYQL